MEDYKLLNDILNACLELDKTAAIEYGKFAKLANDASLSEFWHNMSREEYSHAGYWKRLIALSEQDALPQIFDYPEKTLDELRVSMRKVEMLLAGNDPATTEGNLITAARMEFYMLHRAFCELFHFISNISEEENIEDEYEKHVMEFIDGLMKFGKNRPELEMLAETLERLWRDSRELSTKGSTDLLTGIFNRRGFIQTVTPLIHLSARNGYQVGVLMFDADDFKNINDTLGHIAGDAALQFIASSIRSNLRRSDVAGRWGGEEFLVFLSKIEPGAANAVGEKIRALIEIESKRKVPVTVSVGIYEGIPGENKVHQDLESFIKTADDNLYAAKRAGKNRVVSTSV